MRIIVGGSFDLTNVIVSVLGCAQLPGPSSGGGGLPQSATPPYKELSRVTPVSGSRRRSVRLHNTTLSSDTVTSRDIYTALQSASPALIT